MRNIEQTERKVFYYSYRMLIILQFLRKFNNTVISCINRKFRVSVQRVCVWEIHNKPIMHAHYYKENTILFITRDHL